MAYRPPQRSTNRTFTRGTNLLANRSRPQTGPDNSAKNANKTFNKGTNLLANRNPRTPHTGDRDVPGRKHTPTPGKPKPPTIPKPFLTPAQSAALSRLDLGYSTRTGSDLRRMSDSTFNTNQALASARQAAGARTAQTNENTAARGLFTSSIRDGDLNDIAATLTMRTNILNTNLSRLITDASGDLSSIASNYAITHNLYNQLAVQNAQTVPVSPTPPKAPQPDQAGAGSGQYTPNAPQLPSFQVTTQPFPPQAPPQFHVTTQPFPQGSGNPNKPRGPRGTPYSARNADAVGGMGGLVRAA